MRLLKVITGYLCNDIKKIGLKLYLLEQKICMQDPELRAIKKRIEQVRDDANKFDQFRQVSPLIKRTISRCKEQEINLQILQAKLSRVKTLIQRLYVADVTQNIEEKRSVFHELKNERMLETDITFLKGKNE